MTASGKLHKK